MGTHLRVISYPLNTSMIGFRWFSKLCVLVLWSKVASVVGGLTTFMPCSLTIDLDPQLLNFRVWFGLGLVVIMPGSFKCEVAGLSPRCVRITWLLYKCAALWSAVYGISATERPLGTICEEKGTSSRYWFSISSCYDLSC